MKGNSVGVPNEQSCSDGHNFWGLIHADDTYDEGEDIASQLEGLERTAQGYRLVLPIPSVFYKYIIGARGATRENIESDTKCHLNIPRRGEVGNVGMYMSMQWTSHM